MVEYIEVDLMSLHLIFSSVALIQLLLFPEHFGEVSRVQDASIRFLAMASETSKPEIDEVNQAVEQTEMEAGTSSLGCPQPMPSESDDGSSDVSSQSSEGEDDDDDDVESVKSKDAGEPIKDKKDDDKNDGDGEPASSTPSTVALPIPVDVKPFTDKDIEEMMMVGASIENKKGKMDHYNKLLKIVAENRYYYDNATSIKKIVKKMKKEEAKILKDIEKERINKKRLN